MEKLETKNKLKDYRIKSGITKAVLARKAGVSERTISRAENDTYQLREETEYKILNALNELAKTSYVYKKIFGS